MNIPNLMKWILLGVMCLSLNACGIAMDKEIGMCTTMGICKGDDSGCEGDDCATADDAASSKSPAHHYHGSGEIEQ